MIALMRRLLDLPSANDPRFVTIPPRADFGKPAGFKQLERETKRLQAIAFLGDKWVLAGTRQDVIARVQGLV